jgi:hypothetical protein
VIESHQCGRHRHVPPIGPQLKLLDLSACDQVIDTLLHTTFHLPLTRTHSPTPITPSLSHPTPTNLATPPNGTQPTSPSPHRHRPLQIIDITAIRCCTSLLELGLAGHPVHGSSIRDL